MPKLGEDYKSRRDAKSLNLKTLVVSPVLLILVMIAISIGTNMMPFYADGSRMNLADGGLALINDGASSTAPYEIPESGPALTDKVNDREPVNHNYITAVPYGLADLFRVDVYTGFILFIMVLATLYSLAISVIEIPFAAAEQRIFKIACDPSVNTDQLKAALAGKTIPGYLFALIFSVAVSLAFPNVLFNLGEHKMGLTFDVTFLIFVPILMFRAFRFAGDVRAFHDSLFIRRCGRCHHMDTLEIMNKEFLGTYSNETVYKTKWSDGRTTTRTESNVYAKHRYEVQCENCGDRFVFKG